MNLQQTVSVIVKREVSEEYALNFVKTQFGLLTSYLRSTYKRKPYIVIIKNGSMSNPRATLANLKEIYKSIQDIHNDICYDEDDPIAIEDVTIIPISKFMDLCNMNDSDELDLLDYYGYTNII